MDLVRSKLLSAFPHGFTTRRGGVSPAPWDDLNLGGSVGDDPARVAENWHRLEAATGLLFARVRQVHGARVVHLDAASVPVEEADAVVSTEPGIAACVSVADCVPVLLADPGSGAVCAVHAGWRGTIARVAAEGVRALAEIAGAPPSRLLAAVGPSIGPCCYEVSPELADRFRTELGPVVAGGPAPRLDLWAANRRVLEAAGVAPDRIEVLGRCTSCERDTFFSHRRDAGRTGRQMAFIAPHQPTGGRALP
ncbi:peptidoglycan editing factor PgeF [Anaeromyxobacter oryzisoli]|uniref:peptidoglycan editing factor PgeF n=1 Tax=Anaeromyxobacter oryzisoli TaxID=2925408 RepID=UPI001F57E6F4|nr:peptidoglycan editing factor PgeF [Anaeromyxobacter sp. SG63]